MSPRAALISLALVLLAAPVRGAELTFLAFGDSITEGTGDDRNPPGYPPQLQKMLRQEGFDADVVNLGIGGETTAEGLSRINAALALGGDAILLMEGTNDVSLIAAGELSIESVVANLDEMGRRARGRKIIPVHATIVPRARNARLDRNNIIGVSLIWEIRDLAIRTSRALADVWEIFDINNDPDALRDLISTVNGDPIGHPNAEGYDRIAAVFLDVVLERDTVPPLPGFFDPVFTLKEIDEDASFRAVLYEPRAASGIELRETYLLINGRVVAEPDAGQSNRRKAVMEHQGPDGVGCRVELSVRSEDRADPPNEIERLLQLYDVKGRSVLLGDVDFDCFIDGNDLVQLGLRFGADQGDDRYAGRYDLTGDGRIDGEDLARLAKNFGKSSL